MRSAASKIILAKENAMSAEKIRSEKLVDPKIPEILDRLDAKSLSPANDAQQHRWRYRRTNMAMSIEHPGGGITKCVGHSRMIWREGVALLCSSFIYPGSSCTLVLLSNENDLMSINGTIEVCKHLQGSFHEVEVKFNKRIDPQMFVSANGPGGGALPAVELSSLRGRVLHLDDAEAEGKLLAHHLRASKISLTSVRTAEQAKTTLEQNGDIDIFLCDLHLGPQGDSLALIKHARDTGFCGPIVVVTAESHPSKIAAAKEAGADEILSKPFTRDTLIKLMISLHHRVGAISGETIYSTLSDQPDVEDLITSYITDVQQEAKALESAMVLKDLDTVRSICLNLKGTAAGYGFATLGAAADEAVRALDSTCSVDEARPKLRFLAIMSTQLELKPTSSSAAA